MAIRTTPDLWTPPVEGVKALVDRKPSPRALAAQTQSAVLLQMRYERWITWHYSRIFADMRRRFESLDHIPDQIEMMAILSGFQQDQQDVLEQLFLRVYPQATAMVLPDDRVKSYRRTLEVKSLTPEQERILEQIRQSLQSSVSSMTSSTLQMLMEIRDSIVSGNLAIDTGFFPRDLPSSQTTSEDDLDRFIESLRSSGAFSPARARTIAVTETNEAVNRSLAQAAEEAAHGATMVKEWSTWQDSLVRRSHRAMQGVVVDDGEFFRVPNRHGGLDNMLWPGDRSNGAGPENYINCRCKAFHYVDE